MKTLIKHINLYLKKKSKKFITQAVLKTIKIYYTGCLEKFITQAVLKTIKTMQRNRGM